MGQLICDRAGKVFVEIAARADVGDQRAQVICADGAIDDLALADMRFGGTRAQDRRDLRVKIYVHPLARRSHQRKVPRHRPLT